jgi:glycosyltransferase involved in cell wall biosynthesis
MMEYAPDQQTPGSESPGGIGSPRLSVVMPVRNAMPFLEASIRSILAQTFADFEFIIFDDDSTDGSRAVMRTWARKDQRIRLYEAAGRMGHTASSNQVAAKARAPIIARMDADDVSHPDRFRRQWEVMRDSPDVVLVGALCDGIDARGQRIRPRDRWRLVRRSLFPPFPHGSVMFRRSVFAEIGGYRDAASLPADQDLFLRMAGRGRVLVLPDVLYHYRYHANNITLSVIDLTTGGNTNIPKLYTLGAMRLWAGRSPAVLRQLLAQGSLDWNLRTLRTLVWAGWGSVSPASLRFIGRLTIRTRDFLAGLRLKDGRPCEWRYE